VKWKLASVCLEKVLIAMPNRCMVYTERVIGSKFILGMLDRTPR
jgi:uncharacterized protein YaiI (UPF0178 family)